jgi:putative aldouronate transport system substrate-binding protein
VTVFNGFGAVVPPTPLDQNPAWQEVSRQLNASVEFTLSGGDPGKMAALIASNDLPDIIIFSGGLSSLPNLPQFLEQQMADLAPYLGGDAAKDYPNLAALPTFSWKNAGCAYNGKLLLWPVARYLPGLGLLRNADVYDGQIGQNYVPKNAADLKRVLQQLNQPKQNQWAWGGSNFPHEYGFFVSMFGAPNNWRLETDGKLTKDIETAEFKAAIAYHRDLFASGLIYPDAYTNDLLAGARGFLQAHTAITGTLYGVTWTDLWSISKSLQPQPHYLPLPPIAAEDGVKPVHHLTPGFIVTSAMKKAQPDRIKELLRILDWLAAPFGSSEDLLLSYGVPGTDYNLDGNGNPIVTDRSNADALGPTWRYIVQRQQVMSYPGWPDYARIGYDFEHVAMPAGINDPTWGLYSATQSKSGPVLNKSLLDGFKGIVMGQRPLEDYDHLVADWKSGGGETIRTELQQAVATTA